MDINPCQQSLYPYLVMDFLDEIATKYTLVAINVQFSLLLSIQSLVFFKSHELFGCNKIHFGNHKCSATEHLNEDFLKAD